MNTLRQNDTPPVSMAVLTKGNSVPGTRFRILQHMEAFAAAGIEVRHLDARFGSYPPHSKLARLPWFGAALAEAAYRALQANRSQVCLMQRELVSTFISAEPLIRAPIVFDVDDAIFAGPRGWMTDRVARRAALIVCGNRYLADHYERLARVAILPTAVDTERFVPAAYSPAELVVGWSGTSSGFPYLYEIEDALCVVLNEFPEAVLEVVAERPPQFRALPSGRLRFRRWSPEIEVEAVQGFAVGLMPLPDTPWARGKCSFKMLTYMAVGVPVVVSPVGMNSEVLALGPCGYAAGTTEEWIECIRRLLSDRDSAARLGKVGRTIVEKHFARSVIGPQLAQLVRGVVAAGV